MRQCFALRASGESSELIVAATPGAAQAKKARPTETAHGARRPLDHPKSWLVHSAMETAGTFGSWRFPFCGVMSYPVRRRHRPRSASGETADRHRGRPAAFIRGSGSTAPGKSRSRRARDGCLNPASSPEAAGTPLDPARTHVPVVAHRGWVRRCSSDTPSRRTRGDRSRLRLPAHDQVSLPHRLTMNAIQRSFSRIRLASASRIRSRLRNGGRRTPLDSTLS